MKNKFYLISRVFLGSVFVYASFHKIIYPAEFAKIIYGYYLFPENTINLIAIILPFIELVCGLFLIFGIKEKASVIIINGLLLAFIIAISINLIRGHKFDCGCFSIGKDGHSSSWELLIRDVFYLTLGIYILLVKSKNLKAKSL